MSDELQARAELRIQDVEEALGAVGVRRGTGLVLHSSLRGLGKLEGVPVAETPGRIVQAILGLIGEEGTLCVPAPNWDYGSKRVPFDLRKSRVAKEIGVLSSHVAGLPGRVRSPNPIFSVAGLGRRAAEICGGCSGSAFGPDSPWDRMFQADFLVVFLGCDLASLTFARFVEHRFGVPYLYNKLFDVPVLEDGRDLGLTVTAPLRFQEFPAQYDLARFEQRLRAARFLGESGPAKAVRMSDCFAMGTTCLREDIHYFLERAPAYRPGSLPVA